MPLTISIRTCAFVLTAILALLVRPTMAAEGSNGRPNPEYDLYARTNLLAWCIVPFDSKKRGPEERAAMLEQLQVNQFVYDYRAEHIPTFDAEIEALSRHHIKLIGWWFPTSLNEEARATLEIFRKHQIHPQLWVMGGGAPTSNGAEQQARVKAESKRIAEIARAAGQVGSVVGLYNHGGWFGEPENQIEIIQQLHSQNITNVGIVYNLHHGHDHMPRFPELLQKMKPYLLALNLNGMDREGEKNGRQILPIGQGKLDLELLKIINDSGWRGPIGILCHAQVDAGARLQDNLDGLNWLKSKMQGKNPGPKPVPRSWPETKR